MSRTFFSLRRMRRFISRHPAPLTREDARLVSCPGLLHLSSGIFLSSDDADRSRYLYINNIILPPPDAPVYLSTSSPSHQRRRSSGVVPWVAPSQQRHLS